MLSIYGGLMPLRVLEEIRFWKNQEKEHTQVIRALVPNLEPEYVRLLQEWEPVFAATEFAAQQWIEAVLRSPYGISPYVQAQVDGLLQVSLLQSRRFVAQLEFMLSHSAAIRANPTAQVVVQHIIRESEYFLGVLHAYAYRHSPDPPAPSAPVAFDRSTNDSPYSLSPAYTVNRDEPIDAELGATGEGSWSRPPGPPAPVPIGEHVLPPLPYAYNALEPHIDAETMKLHHDIHHQSYVDGLNKAEKELQKARQTGNYDLIKHWEREAAFHGAGHYLHTLFWSVMTPRGGGRATGPLAQQLERDYGSFDAFRKHFSAAAEKVEGSGWAILVWSPRSQRTQILQAEKHQNLSQWDVVPLLPLDVWEHAYYLKYRTKRAAYVEAWWNTVNWAYVNDRFTAARMLKWPPS
ncbi:Fe-Mn family superoxide dismutase [Paenibacillus aurantius]|uniref:superoxide dismutase n=1 Tax=Paenibacillus aurantius TaxID=2918900 RepID=A0AA96LN07_9BACL|nr:Fe-Mn family superoxide dismutase [Paenibacillus aurantius]WNQ14147.1 Fe-Mn family superoxide dismutase [Paenibacillus aurantius]